MQSGKYMDLAKSINNHSWRGKEENQEQKKHIGDQGLHPPDTRFHRKIVPK